MNILRSSTATLAVVQMKRGKGIRHAKPVSSTAASGSTAHIVSADDRSAAGKTLRNSVARESHGRWKAFKGRPSPIDILHKSDAGRLTELVPIRCLRRSSGARLCRPQGGREERHNQELSGVLAGLLRFNIPADGFGR